MNQILPSLTFYSCYLVFTLVYIPVAFLLGAPVCLMLPLRSALKVTRRLIHYYGVIAICLAWPWIRVRVTNHSGIAPGQPCIFISNHQSVADPYLMSLFPNEFVFISNRWPFRIPLLGFFAKLAGYLNVQSLKQEVFWEQARKNLDEGVALFSFAEGTRTRNGKLGPFHTIPFRLAQEMKVPIVPLCITGLYQIIPRGHMLIRPGTIKIHALPCIPPEEFRELNAHQIKQKVWKLIDCQIAAMEGAIPCT